MEGEILESDEKIEATCVIQPHLDDTESKILKSRATKFRDLKGFGKNACTTPEGIQQFSSLDNHGDFPAALEVVSATRPNHEIIATIVPSAAAVSQPTSGSTAHVTHLLVADVGYVSPATLAIREDDSERENGIARRKLMFVAKVGFVVIFVAIAVAIAVALENKRDASSTTNTSQIFTPGASANLTDIGSTNPTNSPTTNPSDMLTASPTGSLFNYKRSNVYPAYNPNFDHLKEHGFSASSQSMINKIREIQVFLIVGTKPSHGSLPAICLTTTYLLNDCTTLTETNGCVDRNYTADGVIVLENDTYITSIELFNERYVSDMKICTSSGRCHGWYRSTTGSTVVFNETDSVIKAFYGFSGLWLDALGVYYEDAGASTNTCS